PAPSTISTLSLHDALPISPIPRGGGNKDQDGSTDQTHLPKPRREDRSRHNQRERVRSQRRRTSLGDRESPQHGPTRLGDCASKRDRKSTRLNSSHVAISYA